MAKEKGPVRKKKISVKNLSQNSLCSSYLAGLFEGDGHIWISQNISNKKHNPRFCITFGLKNEPLAMKLLSLIGCGHIRYKREDNTCVLIISPVQGLIKLVHLLNGQLRTPKISQFYLLIDWLNTNHGTNIEKLPLKSSNLNDDGWLAGFVDADGSFSVQHTSKESGALKRKVSCRLRIEQRMIEPKTKASYFNIMNQIACFLVCNLLTRKQLSTGNEYYSLCASNRQSVSIILHYFERFPLFSSKHLDYMDWSKAASLLLQNEHYKEENLVIIDSLKSKMNNSRVEFSWDHLDKLHLS